MKGNDGGKWRKLKVKCKKAGQKEECDLIIDLLAVILYDPTVPFVFYFWGENVTMVDWKLKEFTKT